MKGFFSRSWLLIIKKGHPDTSGLIPEVRNAILKVQQPIPEVQNTIRKVQEPIPEVRNAIPKVQSPVPEVRNAILKVQQPIPEVQNTIRKVQEPIPEVRNAILKVQEPIPEVRNAILKVQEPIPEVRNAKSMLFTGFYYFSILKNHSTSGENRLLIKNSLLFLAQQVNESTPQSRQNHPSGLFTERKNKGYFY
ncbi:MAG: hypothetical protein ACHQNT_01925 [Bacteroidia bacterium]